MARKKPHSLTTNGQAVAKKARGTWRGVQSSVTDAVDRGHTVADSAHDTITGARKETAKRANATRDALAGRSQRRRKWAVLAAAASAGIGAVAGAVGARLLGRMKQAEIRPSETFPASETDPMQVPATPTETVPAETMPSASKPDESDLTRPATVTQPAAKSAARAGTGASVNGTVPRTPTGPRTPADPRTPTDPLTPTE